MFLILNAVLSLLPSLLFCFIFFHLINRKCRDKFFQSTIDESIISSRKPSIDYTLDNFFSDDMGFIQRMKLLLDDYADSVPIILRGKTGVGKTHLMRAFQNFLIDKNNSMRTCYITVENFMNEYTEALRAHKIKDFRSKFRNLDALLIDDFMYSLYSQRIQEEIYYTLAQLLEKRALICIAVTEPCIFKEGLLDILTSLLQQSVVIDIPIPKKKTKQFFIEKLFADVKCSVNDDLVAYLANSEKNMCEIKGVVKTLIFVKQLREKGYVNLGIDEIKKLW